MALQLPPELEQFAQQQIASGNYVSLEELLLAGLQILAEREQLYQGREALRREVLLGVKEAEAGNLLDAEIELAAIRQRLHQRHLEA
jgi:putative addiction module CopG family antidote